MSGLSLYHDGSIGGSIINGGRCVSVSPLEISLPGGSDPELVLRSLFDQIVLDDCSMALNHPQGSMSGGLGIKFVQGPSPDIVYVEFSDILTHWIQKLCSSDQKDDSSKKEHIESLICKILNEKIPKAKGGRDLCNLRGWGPSCYDSLPLNKLTQKREEPLHDMLKWVKEVAKDPCELVSSGAAQESQKWWNAILTTRCVLLQSEENTSDAEEFPYRKKQRIHRYLRQTSKGTINFSSDSALNQAGGMKVGAGTLNQPKRRSQRSLGLLKLGESQILRKRVPIGSFFQADVPYWTGSACQRELSSSNSDSTDLKWLGIRMWPVDDKNSESGSRMSGEDMSDLCSCYSPGSMGCVRTHIRMARLQVRLELGQAFLTMGFDNMGEEVLYSWSCDERKSFEMLVKMNPPSECKSFWPLALQCFPSKSRQDIVSYYFNVHVYRRMISQTRFGYAKVDSDDDECSMQDSEVSYSQRMLSQGKC